MILALAASFLGASGALWMIVFIYAFLSNAFFLVRLFLLMHISFSQLYIYIFRRFQLRSLRSVVLPDPSSVPPAQATATVNSAQRRRRIIFLFLEAVTQILYMGWLVKI